MPSLKDFPFSVSFVLLCVSVLTSVPGFNALTAVTPAAIVPIPKNAAKDALIAFSLALCATPFIILCFSSGVNFLFNFFSYYIDNFLMFFFLFKKSKKITK